MAGKVHQVFCLFPSICTVLFFAVFILACGSRSDPKPGPYGGLLESHDSALLRALEKFPASFKEEGVWFGDQARALELAGVKGSIRFSELRSMDPDNTVALLEAYAETRSNVVLDPQVNRMTRTYGFQFEERYGFNITDIALSLNMGRISSFPFAVAYMDGAFDAKDLRERFINLGYEERNIAGHT